MARTPIQVNYRPPVPEPEGYLNSYDILSWLVSLAESGKMPAAFGVDNWPSAVIALIHRLRTGAVTAVLFSEDARCRLVERDEWWTQNAVRDLERGYVDLTGDGVLVLEEANGTRRAISSQLTILFRPESVLAAFGLEFAATGDDLQPPPTLDEKSLVQQRERIGAWSANRGRQDQLVPVDASRQTAGLVRPAPFGHWTTAETINTLLVHARSGAIPAKFRLDNVPAAATAVIQRLAAGLIRADFRPPGMGLFAIGVEFWDMECSLAVFDRGRLEAADGASMGIETPDGKVREMPLPANLLLWGAGVLEAFEYDAGRGWNSADAETLSSPATSSPAASATSDATSDIQPAWKGNTQPDETPQLRQLERFEIWFERRAKAWPQDQPRPTEASDHDAARTAGYYVSRERVRIARQTLIPGGVNRGRPKNRG